MFERGCIRHLNIGPYFHGNEININQLRPRQTHQNCTKADHQNDTKADQRQCTKADHRTVPIQTIQNCTKAYH